MGRELRYSGDCLPAARDLHPMSLTPQQIRDFYELGWTVIPRACGPDELAVMRRAFDRLIEIAARLRTTQNHEGSYFVLGEAGGEVIIKRVVWAGGCQPDLLAVGADRRLLEPATQLLGSAEVEHLLNQAHFKRPGDGVRFDWHQDIVHRERGPGTWVDVNGRGSYVQTALCVDDMTEENGPLMFVKGSPAWGKVDFGRHDYDEDYEQHMPAQFDPADVVTITAEAGTILLFGPYSAHASFENNSSRSRRILINGYAYPGANHFRYPGAQSGRTLRWPPG